MRVTKKLILVGLVIFSIAFHTQAQQRDSLDIKIGQMILIGVPGTSVDATVLKEIKEGKAGSIIFFEKNIAKVHGYHHMLARRLLKGADKEFWSYHLKIMADMAVPFEWQKMVRPLILESVDALVHFKRTTRSIVAAWQAAQKRKQEEQSNRFQMNVVRGN